MLLELSGGYFAELDDTDEPFARAKDWRAQKVGSAVYVVAAGEGRSSVLLHRLILSAPYGMMVDHADRNGLNNRRHNLRLCSNSQNMMNIAKSPGRSSIFKGVAWHRRSRKWDATIMQNKKKINLGAFRIEEEAARAYDKAATLLFGEFARTNEMMGLFWQNSSVNGGSMIDWNALAEKHKLGSTDVERTLTLVCREMAKLVPQELAMPGEPLPPVQAAPQRRSPIASLEGEEAASG